MSLTPTEATEIIEVLEKGHESVLNYVETRCFYTDDVEVQLKAVAALPELIFLTVQEDLHMMGFEKVQPDIVYSLESAMIVVSENGVFYAEWNLCSI